VAGAPEPRLLAHRIGGALTVGAGMLVLALIVVAPIVPAHARQTEPVLKEQEV
jgi:hypothetical protein